MSDIDIDFIRQADSSKYVSTGFLPNLSEHTGTYLLKLDGAEIRKGGKMPIFKAEFTVIGAEESPVSEDTSVEHPLFCYDKDKWWSQIRDFVAMFIGKKNGAVVTSDEIVEFCGGDSVGGTIAAVVVPPTGRQTNNQVSFRKAG